MNENAQQRRRTDGRTYRLNRNRMTAEALAPFAGQFVAINDEGTTVVAHGEDRQAVWAMLDDLGIDASCVVFSYVPALNEDTWL